MASAAFGDLNPTAVLALPPAAQASLLTDLLNGPALAPPPGVTPDFEHPGGVHATAYGVLWTCSILALLSIATRLASRAIVGHLRLEDGLFVCALGLFAGNVYVIYDGVIWPGLQVHQWDIQLKNYSAILWDAHLGTLLYGLTIMLLKVGILLDWIEIFIPPNARSRSVMFWCAQALIWGNLLFYVVGTFVEIFKCKPREKIWNPLIFWGTCLDMEAHYIASGVINLISDIAILLLPQRVIWKLNMSMARKISISILFGIGLLAIAFCIARAVYTLQMLDTSDTVYTVGAVGLWFIGEVTCGFLVVGIPCIPKVVKALPAPISDPIRSMFHSVLGGSSMRRGSDETVVGQQQDELSSWGQDSNDTVMEKRRSSRKGSLPWNRQKKQRDQWGMTVDDVMDEEHGGSDSRGQTMVGGRSSVGVDSERNLQGGDDMEAGGADHRVSNDSDPVLILSHTDDLHSHRVSSESETSLHQSVMSVYRQSLEQNR